MNVDREARTQANKREEAAICARAGRRPCVSLRVCVCVFVLVCVGGASVFTELLESALNLRGLDDLHIGVNVVLHTEVHHFLSGLDATDERSGKHMYAREMEEGREGEGEERTRRVSA